MNRLTPRIVLALALVPAPVTLAQPAAAPILPLCLANQLSLSTDDEGGNFNGMSHSGTLVVLRNLGPSACRLPPVPQLLFRNSDNGDVPILIADGSNPFRGPLVDGKRLPMGHGPVILPLVLAFGAEATATLTWVSGDVYDHGTCLTPASLLVRIEGSTLATVFQRRLCGPDAAHVAVIAARFVLDPVYRP